MPYKTFQIQKGLWYTLHDCKCGETEYLVLYTSALFVEQIFFFLLQLK